MNALSPNIKSKIALHSLGFAFILTALLLISITIYKIPIAQFLLLGSLTSAILSIIFSKRKYLISIQQDENKITIKYLNRMLIEKSVSMDKTGLNILDIKEVNWWNRWLDLINFSNEKQNLTFNCIDRNLKQIILANLENE